MQTFLALQRQSTKLILSNVSHVSTRSTQACLFSTINKKKGFKPGAVGKPTNKSAAKAYTRPSQTSQAPPVSDVQLSGGLIPNVNQDALPNPVTATKVTPLQLPASGHFPFGMLAQIPQAPLSDDLVRICISRARDLKVAKFVTGDKEKQRDLGMRKLNVFTEYCLYRLDKCIHSIPHDVSLLHPFERTVVGLTLGPHNSKPVHYKQYNEDDSQDELPVPSQGDYSEQQKTQQDNKVNNLLFGGHTVSGERHLAKVMGDTVRLRNKIQSCYEEHSNKLKRYVEYTV